MGKVTNEAGIPPVLFEAIKQNWYSGEDIKKDYSVTELLKPDRIICLSDRHKDEFENEAADLFWSVFGSAVHKILERGSKSKDRYILEHRFISDFMGKLITGQGDIMDSERKTLEDYKVTSVWKYIFRNKKNNRTIADWTYQLNMYRYFLKKEGFEIDKLFINLIFRDWTASKVERNRDYPKQPIVALEMDIMPDAEVEAYLEERIKSLEKLKDVPDEELPVCSMTNRWQDKDKYAVRKKTNKRASKVCYSMKQAKGYVYKRNNPDDYVIDIRKSKPTRCLSYCSVAPFCNWFQNWKRSQ